MPPSATTTSRAALLSDAEGMNAALDAVMNDYPNEHIQQLSNANGNEYMGTDPNPWTAGYKHGYTDGYINGYSQAELPKLMPIAIVGMSCRLPGDITTPDELWELCSRGRSGFSEIPKQRFENASFHHPNPGKSGCFNAVGGNFLKEDLGLFDAPFFSLTAQEAKSMDPQQRILLECTFEALDSAGIPKHQIVGKEVGVFIGGSFSEYESQMFADTDAIPMYQASGCSFAMQSNRISHFFDFRGPSFTIDTACSSTLVAIHLACQSIRNGESKIAIVGGCHLNMSPEYWISMSMSRLFSDEGRSFAFDNRGTGFGRGEGCGMVVLKPLDQALKDNDIIRSVIVATGVNQDGKTPGITMPSGQAQEQLMHAVYKSAGISPTDTGYVEAHGTGTKVGDPIEAAALHNIFHENRSPRNPLFIGSVKSNVGHLEAASGIVALIKTSMMLERGFVLPNYDFQKPNDKIPMTEWNLKVPISQRPWPRLKRFASINNFGFGGTNAHAVLERAPFLKKYEPGPDAPDYTFQSRKLFVLSANDKLALEVLMKKMGIYLEQRPEIFQNDLMSNVAYTLGQRRSLMQWRVAMSSSTSFDLIQALNSGKIVPAREAEAPRIGFIFTGQGAQWNAMGRELYAQYPVFKSTLDACDKSLASLGAPFSLIDELSKDAKSSQINEAHVSQPACTAIQLALTDLLRAWGVRPIAVAGHSSGEIGAAYAAGILPLETCMAISYFRGVAVVGLKKLPNLKGAMMAVGCSQEEIAPFIAELKAKEVGIACFNSPSSLTISGDEVAIDELQAIIEKQQMFNRKLQVDVAYHSHHMKLVAEEYHESLKSIDLPSPSSVTFHSSLLGRVTESTKLEPSYWVDNMTNAVRFSEAVTSMCAPANGFKTAVNIIVEIGPHSALAGPVKQILKAGGPDTMKILYVPALVRKKDAVETALELAAALFLKGENLKFGAINFPKPGKPPVVLVDMPRYPWNHQAKYWHEPRVQLKLKNRTAPRNDILGTIATYSNDLEPTWRNIVRVDDLPWLRHHKIQSLTLFPLSGFIAMALEATSQKAATRGITFDKYELRDVSVNVPLIVTDDDIEMTLQLRPHQEWTLTSSETWDEFRIHSWTANKGWTEHCKGLITTKNNAPRDVTGVRAFYDSESLLQSSISEICSSGVSSVDKAKMYDSLEELGVSYGPTFQGIHNCQASDNCSMATITVQDTSQDMPHGFQTSMIVHPAFLEQIIEMYWPILGAGRTSIGTVYLPSSIGFLTVSSDITHLTNKPGNSLRAFCKGPQPPLYVKPVQLSMFATAIGDSKKAVISLENLTISPIIERDSDSTAGSYRELCYKMNWESILQPLEHFLPHGAAASKGIDHTNGFSPEPLESSNGISAAEPLGLLTPISEQSCDCLSFPDGEVVIIHAESESQKQLSMKLADALELRTGNRPDVTTLELSTAGDKLYIFVPELHQPLLSSLTPNEFKILQKLITGAKGILWVVRGAYIASNNPDANMINGFSRSIRSETLLKFATLDLDPNSTVSDETTAEAILKVFEATFTSNAGTNCELEFVERQGSFFTPRVIVDAEMNEYVHTQMEESVLESTPFVQKYRALKMAIRTPGVFETLYFVDDDSVETPLLGDEIEIEVKAIGMNSTDLMALMDQTDTSNIGLECSGIITKIGVDVQNFEVGDRVAAIAMGQGVYSSHTRTKADFALNASNELSFEAAASIPVAFCTAQYSLLHLAHLTQEDIVLIHGATTPLGQAAISLANLVGAEVFVTSNSSKETNILTNSCGISGDHVFPSSNASFRPAILQATHQRGVDVVLSCLSTDADTTRETWACLGNFGRYVVIGSRDGKANLQASRFENNASYMSVDLMSLAIGKPTVMKRLMSDVSALLTSGKVGATSFITVFPISDVFTAFKVLSSGNTSSKLVVMPQLGDQVKASPSNRQKSLREDATYILIGGTGGLGRSMARWMVEKGAKHIALVSRSGSETGKVKELIEDMASVGANVVVRRCDVIDTDSVNNLLSKELFRMPPVRGVIHGTMVLQDVLFEKMTYDQYNMVIEGKVKGAWNLHKAIKTPLDFFVVISSAAGIVGNRGQAAYSAANTFLNGFVQYRLGLGLPASSIDLTAVSDAGYLAENLEAAAEVAKNLGSDTICEREVLALLGAAITGRLASACNSHTITGVRITPSTPFWTTDAKFKHLRLAAEALAAENSAVQAVTISFSAAIKAAKTLEEATEVVINGLLSKLPSLLMLEVEDMDVTKALSSYALDSLVAIELRNFITREFEANLQVLELLSSGSIETLATAICAKSKLISL